MAKRIVNEGIIGTFTNRKQKHTLGLIIIDICLVMAVVGGIKEIMVPRTIVIENVHAAVVPAASEVESESIPAIQVADAGASAPVAPDSIKTKIKAAFPDNWQMMYAIGMGESGLNPNTPPNPNPNGTTDTGIFRINSCHGYSQAYLEDVDNNIKVAKEIYAKQGYNGWVAYRNGSYQKFL